MSFLKLNISKTCQQEIVKYLSQQQLRTFGSHVAALRRLLFNTLWCYFDFLSTLLPITCRSLWVFCWQAIWVRFCAQAKLQLHYPQNSSGVNVCDLRCGATNMTTLNLTLWMILGLRDIFYQSKGSPGLLSNSIGHIAKILCVYISVQHY